MVVSNMTLVKIGAVGGILTVSMGLALRRQINGKIKQSEPFKEAMKMLRSHNAAVHLLGEPIKDGTIDPGDQENNISTPDAVQYRVPVKGPKQKGELYMWANRLDSDKWEVSRLELSLNNEPNRRLLIKK